MDGLGRWLGFGFRHFQEHWQKHLVPGLVMFGLVFVMVMAVFVLFGIGFAVGIVTGEEELGMMLGMVLGGVSMLVLPLMIAPIQLGYMRGTLRLMRGGEFGVGDLFGSLRDAPAAMVVMVVVMVAAMTAAMFCYFPAFLVAALFFHALPSLADKGGSPIAALKHSVELARKQYWGLVLYVFIYGFLLAMLGYVPLIGPILAIPLGVIFCLAPYVDATADEDELF